MTQVQQHRSLKLDRLSHGQRMACIDGRHHRCVVGAPGGSLGELLVVLAAALQAGLPLTEAKLYQAVRQTAVALGHLYHHSDQEALVRLGKALEEQLPPACLASNEALFECLRAPPPEHRAVLLAQLVRPEHIGCGHFAQVITRPEAYGVTRALPETLLKAFYEGLWDGLPMELEILDGHHEEVAVVAYRAYGAPLDPQHEVPVPCLSEDAPQVFVDHRAARRFFRQQVREQLAATLDLPQLLTLEPADRLLAERHTELTLKALAPALPWIEVQVVPTGGRL